MCIRAHLYCDGIAIREVTQEWTTLVVSLQVSKVKVEFVINNKFGDYKPSWEQGLSLHGQNTWWHISTSLGQPGAGQLVERGGLVGGGGYWPGLL